MLTRHGIELTRSRKLRCAACLISGDEPATEDKEISDSVKTHRAIFHAGVLLLLGVLDLMPPDGGVAWAASGSDSGGNEDQVVVKTFAEVVNSYG